MKKIGVVALLLGMAGALPAAEVVWKGDIRVRSETYTHQGQPNEVVNRQRMRFRYGFQTELSENLNVYARMATSKLNDPTGFGEFNSSNQTYKGMNPMSLFLDQAYISYRPNVEWLERYKLYAGKMVNYFATTPLTWDADINPDGMGHEYNLGSLVFRAAQWTLASDLKPELNTGIYAYQIGWRGDIFDLYLSSYNDSRVNFGTAGATSFNGLLAFLTLGNLKLTADLNADPSNGQSGFLYMAELNKVKAAGDWALKLGWFHYDPNFKPFGKDSDYWKGIGAVTQVEGWILGGGIALEDNLEVQANFLKKTDQNQKDLSNVFLDAIVKF